MSLIDISSWLSPNSVSIFIQPPGQAFVQFLLANVPIPDPSRVRLDLAESETHSRSWSITRNPVERMVAQNRIREPLRLSITGMLCATPLQSPLQFTGLGRLDRVMLEQLYVLLEREVVFIVTPEGKFANMACASITANYDESTGNGVQLSMEFEQISIVSPVLVSSAFDSDVLNVVQSPTNQGPSASTTITDPGGLG